MDTRMQEQPLLMHYGGHWNSRTAMADDNEEETVRDKTKIIGVQLCYKGKVTTIHPYNPIAQWGGKKFGTEKKNYSPESINSPKF